MKTHILWGLLSMIIAMTALALAAFTAATLAPASAGAPDVDATETPYQAWILRCETRKAPQPSVTLCGLMSVVKAKDETGRSAILTSIMLRPVPGTKNVQLSFSLPLAVMLQPGAKVSNAQDKEIVHLPFIACRSQGCEAGAVLTQAQLDGFLASSDQNSVSYDLQNRKSLNLAFSMSGFKDAFEHLQDKR
jgi:invasion protein IalB